MVTPKELRELAEVMRDFGIVRLKCSDLEIDLVPGASADVVNLDKEQADKLAAELGIGAEPDSREAERILFGPNGAPEYRSDRRRMKDQEEGIDAP